MDGGQTMLDAEFALKSAVERKNNSADVVTQFDKKIEDMVEKKTHDAYPSFGFIGGETFKHGTKLADTPTFVCDPIDGTLNFTKGVPNCAISLALTLDKRPVVGVVYNPFRGDLYHAIKDQGAYLTKTHDGRQIKLPIHPIPPPMPSLQSCLGCVEWGNQRQGPN
jgi:myo-inositol-1(or 4)-monophosphatase